MLRQIFLILFCVILASSWAGAAAAAATGAPIYDWDFTPSHVKVTGPQSITGYVTIRNLPDSPVNLTGSQWYALDMYPGDAVDEDGPFKITGLSSAGFESMNLAPGQSKTVPVVSFAPQGPLSIGYSGLLIAGAHMRVLGPNNEFIDVGGLDKPLRITVIPEPTPVSLCAVAVMVILSVNRLGKPGRSFSVS